MRMEDNKDSNSNNIEYKEIEMMGSSPVAPSPMGASSTPLHPSPHTGIPVKGSVSVWQQYVILMKKNWITTKRNRTVTIAQLFMPFCFVFLLYLLSSSIQDMSTASIEISKVTHPEETIITSIPKFSCIEEIYGTCYTIAYAPNNISLVKDLVEKVAWKSGLTDSDVIGFGSEYEMDDYILQNPWTIQAGYLFLQWENGVWEYAVQFNETTTKHISHLFEEYSASDIVVPMATMMDREIIQYQQRLSNLSSPDLDYTFATLQFPQQEDLRNDFMMYMFPIFFLAMMMLYFVTMARGLVLEKELKLKEGMRMMGLKELPYWASWFSYYVIIVIVATFVAIISGHIFSLDVIKDNDFASVFFLLLLFGISMLALAFLLAALQDKSSLTLTTGFIMWVISASIFSTINESVYDYGNSVIVANILSLYSPFAFSKGMFDLSRAAFENNGRSFSDRNNKDYSDIFWLEKVYHWLIMDTFIYLVIAFYVTIVFPGEFGVPKPFYFFLQPSYWTGKPSKRANKRRTKFTPHKVVDDDDVMEEERKVKEETLPEDTVVVIEDLMKVYKSGFFGTKSFTAVKGLSMAMQNNQLFCLLGPNGAGKSTTFNMLSGIFPSSAGDAVLFGHSIVDEMDEIRKIMGVCAQHDLLWDELTGKEHLEFFCRFKGIPKEYVEREVAHRLELVGLTDVGNVPTSVYSGGEKRRLSVALATVGNPKIIFLDEPTTGMDPVSRQQVWKVISEAKKGRVVILTTHSMEEADVLSDRIAIVAHGQLRCIGTNIHLKNKFGSGYQLTLVFPPANSAQVLQNISTFVKTHLPQWNELFEAANTTPQSIYITIPYNQAGHVADLLQTLEDNAKELGVEEITMNLSSLEEVFIKIAMESQKETTVSMEEIEASSKELMQLAEATKKTTGRKTSFKRQADAMVRKHAAFYKRSWTTLLVQLLIPVIFMLALFATASPDEFKFGDDPHPLILPPQVPYQPRDPVRFTIPYVYSSAALGACCQTEDGFLGLVSFDVLNSSIRPSGAQFPYSLGDYSTSNYTFERYNTNDELFAMLYETTKTGWIAAYIFDTMDFSANRFHVGYLKNISEWGARGAVAGVNLVDNAILAATTSPDNSLTVRLKGFPSREHTLKIAGSGAAGTWVLLGCSFFMVPILSLIVREKQDRLRNLLVLAGMRMEVYWIVLFVIGLIAYFILMLFWMFLGFIMRQVAFTHIAAGSLVFLFFVYAFNQVGFAFFLSTLVDDEPSAALGGYTWILFFVILTQSIVAIIVDLGTDTQMYGVSVLPPFAVTVVVNAMSTYYFPSGGSMTMEQFYDDRASMALLILFLVGLGFFIVHAYLDQVYPARYGISKHPLFFLSKYRKAKPPQVRMPNWCPSKKDMSVSHSSVEISADAPDVAAERSAALAEYNSPNPNYPLVIPGITKSFLGNGVYKVAVDDLPLLVPHLECFGLLGPNGGGKTSLVNILSGLYPTTAGDGKIKGHSVVEELDKAQRHMGVCPQDCVLWKELSAREHLLLFGRLRNLRGQELETAVNLALKQVLLTDAADRPCGGYSGGMKRRLSLAIGLIGCPSVVLLDEPTTGVDPFSRHVVWETIRAYKHYCTIILITHNMEEADALCERVGMMSEGRMMCIGRPSELKARYNVGYSLTILHNATSPDNIIALVESIVKGAQLLDTFPGSCLFTLPKANTRLSLLFSAFKEQSEQLLISDWAVLPSNLEDVLIKSTHKEM